MDEKGLSPVIGVILMVSITVILAAVIAAFVFAMADPYIVAKEGVINGTVTDRYSYDGVNLFIDVTSYDKVSGAEIKQTLWTTDPVLFHHIYSGGRYNFITKPPSLTKYPQLITVM
jgi:flagellin-like protein